MDDSRKVALGRLFTNKKIGRGVSALHAHKYNFFEDETELLKIDEKFDLITEESYVPNCFQCGRELADVLNFPCGHLSINREHVGKGCWEYYTPRALKSQNYGAVGPEKEMERKQILEKYLADLRTALNAKEADFKKKMTLRHSYSDPLPLCAVCKQSVEKIYRIYHTI